MYVEVDETGRIGATTEYKEYASDTALEIDFPDEFNFSQQNEYRIVDGELIHDPKPEPVESTIDLLKRKLSETDHYILKIAEASIAGTKLTEEESELYTSIIQQRQNWREEINYLESKEENRNG